MARKRFRFNFRKNKLKTSIFLLLTSVGGILFGFGTLNYVQERYSPKIAMVVGAIILMSALFLGFYTTSETIAFGKRR